MARGFRLAFVLTIVAGCLSEDRAEDKWNEWLSEHDDCAAADDCALFDPGCPLGCADAAVNESHLDAAEAEAERLKQRYQRLKPMCPQAGCRPNSGVTCEAGRCVVVW